MTSAVSRAPFQPNSKAQSTSKSSQLLAVAGVTPAASRTTSPAGLPKLPRHDAHNDDFLSESATNSLIRRILVSDSNKETDAQALPHAIEALLPPLTSSNEVDIQLYAIIAIVIKDFVNTWYSKITPDRGFVEEVVQIIAHCSRAVEQRLRRTDVVQLALDEIPALLQRHTEAYRAANDSHAFLSYSNEPPQIYHSLNPHPALDPKASAEVQKQAETAHRQLLVQGALAVLLPTEDLQNSCLRVLVSDIIADLILGRAIEEKLCHGWFLHGVVSKVVAIITLRRQPKVSGAAIQADARSRLEDFGLLSAKSADEKDHSPDSRQSPFAAWFWRLLQWGYLTFLSFRFMALGLMHARQRPPRASVRTTTSAAKQRPLAGAQPPGRDDQSPRPVLGYRLFASISTMLNASRRMPWLTGALSFWQYCLTCTTGRGGDVNTALDKFLYQTLQEHVLPYSLLPLILENTRAVIFPGNTMGLAAPPPPSAEEVQQLRRRAAEDVLGLVPRIGRNIFFATRDREQAIEAFEEEVLDLFSDSNMNKHLIYNILEMVLVTLLPELAEKTPSDLLAERGVSMT